MARSRISEGVTADGAEQGGGVIVHSSGNEPQTEKYFALG
ncbi:hypothetical protein GGE65_002982 [Skermanella aerolata]